VKKWFKWLENDNLKVQDLSY